ncbi:peptide ABC transporter substrate-binding protein [Micromonospora echinofusca]|uniref:ABC transporter substrate-binding protein n=1 Tax=Micromonospora echinofusca TaxID=47858 RepID=A0ABS3VX02_MICEH|nr:peptide ABC transporter substrate-binding protein [Micromonospora echinofusca]MBO4209060.1 ABC transporter substrate-binding protein [Micromonospora echinofusca]
MNEEQSADAGQRVLVEGWAEDVATLNPVLVQDTFSALVSGLCFEGLLTSDGTGELLPALAASVPTVDDDGRTYRFTLREGLRWSDGHPLTAADVVFTYGLMTDPAYEALGSPHRGELTRHLAEVTAPDPRTVVFRTRTVHAPFLVAHGQHGILPAHVLAGTDPAALASAGFNDLPTVVNGVFTVAARTPGEEIRFARNPHYHRGPSRLDGFVYRIFPNGLAVAEALRAGTVDVGLIDPSRLADLAGLPHLRTEIIDLPTGNFYAYQLDPATPAGRILADVRVRRALLLGLDRETLIKEAYLGQASIADSVVPPTSWAHDPQVTPTYPYDPQRAAALLDEAGWRVGSDGVRERDGERLRIELVAGTNTKVWVDTAHALADGWRRLGVDVALTLLDFAELMGKVLQRRDFGVFMLAYTWGQEPDQSELFSSAADLNCFGFADAEVDALLAAATSTLDRAERVRLYHRYQALMAELVPAPMLFFLKGVYGVHRRVHGYRVATYNQFGARPWMHEVTVDDQGHAIDQRQ